MGELHPGPPPNAMLRSFETVLVDRVAVLVAHHLDFDVAWRGDELFDEDAVIAKAGLGFRAHRRKTFLDVLLVPGDADALAAAAGFHDVQILASGGLDEYAISALLDEQAPIDGFGVGSSLGTSADAPTLDTVYKLVAVDGRPVHKTSPGKATWPGPKQVWRDDGWSGDVLALADDEPPRRGSQPLLEVVMRKGERTMAGQRDLAAAHEHFERQWEALPSECNHLTAPAGPAST